MVLPPIFPDEFTDSHFLILGQKILTSLGRLETIMTASSLKELDIFVKTFHTDFNLPP
jgi:hypothetical protein